jgi:tetratricopeptide (TPR) repeat protein
MTALDLFEQGRIDEASAAAERGVADRPDDAEAHGVLGRILARQGALIRAAGVFARATALAPSRPAYAANWAGVLRRLGKYGDARRALARALAAEPGRAELHVNRGNIETAAGDDDAAIGWYERALGLQAGLAKTVINLAQAMRRRGRLSDAIAWLEASVAQPSCPPESWAILTACLLDAREAARALSVASAGLRRFPQDGLLLLNHGAALTDLGRLGEARESLEASQLAAPERFEGAHRLGLLYQRLGDAANAVQAMRRTIVLRPSSPRGWRMLGSLLRSLGQPEEAASVLARACDLQPDHIGTIGNFGAVLEEVGRLPEAFEQYRRAHELAPGSARICDRLGTWYHRQELWRSAEQWYQRAMMLQPEFADAHYHFGLTLRRQGKSRRALGYYENAIALAPSTANYHYERSLALLTAGHAAAGLRDYHWRWHVDAMATVRHLTKDPVFRQPEWTGELLDHRALAVWGEQGLGDEIWFSGYLAALQGVGGRIAVECDPRLAPALARSYPRYDVHERTEPVAEELLACSVQAAVGDLPQRLGLAARSAPTGYLVADRARVEKLRARYARGSGDVLVGFSWRSVKPKQERSFEAPLTAWRSIFAIAGVTFVNLQYGDVKAELEDLADQTGARIVYDGAVDARRDVDGFLAQVAAVDAVVTIANATATAAHGIGRSSFVALRIGQDDWRYPEGAQVTPWLPLARLYWQATRDGWTDVFGRISQDLEVWRRSLPVAN